MSMRLSSGVHPSAFLFFFFLNYSYFFSWKLSYELHFILPKLSSMKVSTWLKLDRDSFPPRGSIDSSEIIRNKKSTDVGQVDISS